MQGSNKNKVQVFIRVRPLISIEQNTQEVVEVQSDDRTVKVSHDTYNQLEVKFDQAFPNTSNQADIFKHFKDVVPKVLEGYNSTIFAYGQTGSGKTYTMFGKDFESNKDLPYEEVETEYGEGGLIPRIVHQLFRRARGDSSISIFCSFLQIYNEKIFDLLSDTDRPKALGVHESKADGIFVEGLTQFGVNNYEDCLQLLQRGVRNRTTRQTSMNAKSSRSHSLFQLLVESTTPRGGVMKTRLNLCDLAGSQKINKKEAMSEAQMKQLKNINLSLTTLGKVIHSLSSGDKKKATGAFRESKLTRLLQESLTGNTLTIIIANLSPSFKNIEQTMNTLKFVERAHHITLQVKPTDINAQNPESMAKLQREVLYLRDMLDLKKKGIHAQELPSQLARLKQENDQLRRKGGGPSDQLERLQRQNKQMRHSIVELQYQLKQVSDHDSLSSHYVQQLKNDKIKYYMPSSRGNQSGHSSDESSRQESRLSNSLVQAGRNIAFNNNKKTIDVLPSRANEKKSILNRLQAMEDRRKSKEYKMIEQMQTIDRKEHRYSPARVGSGHGANGGSGKISGKRQMNQYRSQRKNDYSNKIKQLQAKLYKK